MRKIAIWLTITRLRVPDTMVGFVAFVFSSAVASQAPAVITLERSGCFGTCPAYSVEISGDGRVHYEGKAFVRVAGPADAVVGTASVAALIAEFERQGYFDLDDRYTANVTDHPTTITSIRIGDRFKRVVNYVSGPESLIDIEYAIDRTARSARWVTVDADTVSTLQQTGWNAGGADSRNYLEYAVVRGDEETVVALIRAGASVKSARPLGFARTASMIDVLLANGCRIDGDDDGSTPLMIAVERSKADHVARLIAAGANVNAGRPGGDTPLIIAAERGTPEIVAMLLNARGDPNANGGTLGRATPLMAAAWGDQAENVRLLLRAGADVNAADDQGRTTLSHAMKTYELAAGKPTANLVEILRSLHEYGAR